MILRAILISLIFDLAIVVIILGAHWLYLHI